MPGVPGNEKFAARINYFTGGAARNLSARRASIYFAERTLKRCNALRVSLVVIDDVVLPILDLRTSREISGNLEKESRYHATTQIFAGAIFDMEREDNFGLKTLAIKETA